MFISNIDFLNPLLGAWRYISHFWTSTSTASGWTLCWNMPRTTRRSMQMTMMGESTRRITPATCWRLMVTRNTSVFLSLSTLGKTLSASHRKMKGQLQGAGQDPGPAMNTHCANPTDPVAFPPCRYTTNWTAWGCGWKDWWKALCLAATSLPGQNWIRSPSLNRLKRFKKGHLCWARAGFVHWRPLNSVSCCCYNHVNRKQNHCGHFQSYPHNLQAAAVVPLSWWILWTEMHVFKQ